MEETNEIAIVSAEGREDEFVELIKEYTDWLMSRDDAAVGVLASQGLEHELEDVSAKFGNGRGCMLLALVNGKPAGCVAVTASLTETCEIKRLYVRPEFRGMHLSNLLTGQAIETAREIGYTTMRLDTFAWMETAIALYEKLGFKRIARYNDNKADDAVFMELDLR